MTFLVFYDLDGGSHAYCSTFVSSSRYRLINLCFYCRFFEELDEGIFIQQALETLFINADGQQLMVQYVPCIIFLLIIIVIWWSSLLLLL